MPTCGPEDAWYGAQRVQRMLADMAGVHTVTYGGEMKVEYYDFPFQERELNIDVGS